MLGRKDGWMDGWHHRSPTIVLSSHMRDKRWRGSENRRGPKINIFKKKKSPAKKEEGERE